MSNSPAKMRGLAIDRSAALGVRLRQDLERPVPKAGEVLVRVSHSTVNGHEFELAASALGRLLSGVLRAPGHVRTGLEFAGTVHSDGATFRRGDAVMGYVEMLAGWRPHADFVAIPEDYMAPAPAGLSLEQASTLPMSGLTALEAVRDVAKLQRGQTMLLLGASGGVGILAVQIARHLGVKTTALASKRHHDTLRRLGADETIDYRDTPVAELEGPFDAVLDFSNSLRFANVKHLLAPKGVFIPADPIRTLADVVFSRRTRYLMVDRGSGARVRERRALVEAGALEPQLDRVFELERWEDAVARGHERGRIGRTVLAFA